MKKVSLLLILLLCALNMFAGKADPEPQTIRQSDGSFITVIAHGDEFGNYTTTLDGALLVAEDGFFYIAQVTEKGDLKSSGVLAHEIDKRTQKEKELIEKQDINLFSANYEANISNRKKEATIPGGYFPHTGTPTALVILVEFQDSTFKWSNTKEIFDAYLNAETLDPELADGSLALNYKSVAEYFKEMSFGQFRPQFDLVGPVKLPQPLKYYGAGNDNVSYIVRDAIQMVADSIDFKKYDQDNDKYIDLVYFICASYSQSSNSNITNLIWPKVTTYTYDTGQGVSTKKVGLSCELNKKPNSYPTPHVSGIGLFCHEFSHTLGMPDLYSTTSPAQMLNQTYEYWDLMDGGEYTKNGNYPNAYSAWEREYMNWMEIETLTDSQAVVLKPLSAEGGKAYRIYPEGETGGKQYFIVENIQNVGCNSYVPGHGMIVHTITDNGFSLTPNNSYTTITDSVLGKIYKSNSSMTLIPADGFVIPSYQVGKVIYDGTTAVTCSSTDYANSHYTDSYPGRDSVTEVRTECKDIYQETGSKKYFYTTKAGYTGKPITNIKETQLEGDEFSTITFDFGNVKKEVLAGDANDDGTVDVADITTIASYILGNETNEFNFEAADVDKDGEITVSDITGVASIILSATE